MNNGGSRTDDKRTLPTPRTEALVVKGYRQEAGGLRPNVMMEIIEDVAAVRQLERELAEERGLREHAQEGNAVWAKRRDEALERAEQAEALVRALNASSAASSNDAVTLLRAAAEQCRHSAETMNKEFNIADTGLAAMAKRIEEFLASPSSERSAIEPTIREHLVRKLRRYAETESVTYDLQIALGDAATLIEQASASHERRSAQPVAEGPVYLVDNKPHRYCDCDPLTQQCPRGIKRAMETTQFSRCLLPVSDVFITPPLAKEQWCGAHITRVADNGLAYLESNGRLFPFTFDKIDGYCGEQPKKIGLREGVPVVVMLRADKIERVMLPRSPSSATRGNDEKG